MEFVPQDSSFLAKGKSIKANKRANDNGISTVLANIKMVNKPITVAMT